MKIKSENKSEDLSDDDKKLMEDELTKDNSTEAKIEREIRK